MNILHILDQLIKRQQAMIQTKDSAVEFRKTFENMDTDILTYLFTYWMKRSTSTDYSKEIQFGLGLASAIAYEILQRREQS